MELPGDGSGGSLESSTRGGVVSNFALVSNKDGTTSKEGKDGKHWAKGGGTGARDGHVVSQHFQSNQSMKGGQYQGQLVNTYQGKGPVGGNKRLRRLVVFGCSLRTKLRNIRSEYWLSRYRLYPIQLVGGERGGVAHPDRSFGLGATPYFLRVQKSNIMIWPAASNGAMMDKGAFSQSVSVRMLLYFFARALLKALLLRRSGPKR